MPAMTRLLPLVALSLAALAMAGCVQRTLSITSNPSGALIYLNDEEVGRTPLEVPFTFYGTYDVRLEQDGYKTLWTKQKAKAPWWEAPGPDLIAEAIPNNKTRQQWHFEMESAATITEEDLITRAADLRRTLHPDEPPPDAP